MSLLHRFARLPLPIIFCLALLPGAASSQSISAAQSHFCAVGAAGDLHCWGERIWSTHGEFISLDSSGAMAQPPGVRIKQFETGWVHDCALTSEGKIYCAGGNAAGELGRPLYEPCSSFGCAAPGLIETTERFVSLTVGQSHSCALTVAGVAY